MWETVNPGTRRRGQASKVVHDCGQFAGPLWWSAQRSLGDGEIVEEMR